MNTLKTDKKQLQQELENAKQVATQHEKKVQKQIETINKITEERNSIEMVNILIHPLI